MANANETLAKEIEQLRDELKQVRDELRVRLHLGAMDARDAFVAVEKEVDQAGREISQATKRTLAQAREQLKVLAGSFAGSNDDRPTPTS